MQNIFAANHNDYYGHHIFCTCSLVPPFVWLLTCDSILRDGLPDLRGAFSLSVPSWEIVLSVAFPSSLSLGRSIYSVIKMGGSYAQSNQRILDQFIIQLVRFKHFTASPYSRHFGKIHLASV